MDPTEQLLNRYGLTLHKKNYADKMEDVIKRSCNLLRVDPKKEGLEKSIKEQVLRGFFLSNGSIHVANPEHFKQVFKPETGTLRLPEFLLKAVQVRINLPRIETPCEFAMQPEYTWQSEVFFRLVENDPLLLPLVKEYRLRIAFNPETRVEAAYDEIGKHIAKFAAALNQTKEKTQFEIELTNHLVNKFEKYCIFK